MEDFGAHSDWEISSRQPRAAAISFVGGDVGITPLENRREGEGDYVLHGKNRGVEKNSSV